MKRFIFFCIALLILSASAWAGEGSAPMGGDVGTPYTISRGEVLP